jgi:hypothetical protein
MDVYTHLWTLIRLSICPSRIVKHRFGAAASAASAGIVTGGVPGAGRNLAPAVTRDPMLPAWKNRLTRHGRKTTVNADTVDRS